MLRKKLKLDEQNDTTSNYQTNNNLESAPIHQSRFFSPNIVIADEVLKVETALNESLHKITFSEPIKYVYNPVEYAFDAHANYIRKYCNTEKKVLFIGMNPGPYGMCQTGVPFGEIESVVNYLQIEGSVNKPEMECPERPVLGFNCKRSEASGKRFWNLIKGICPNADDFFKNAFVHNYIPLAFMVEGGNNLTPAEIKEAVKLRQLQTLCDETLLSIIKLLKSTYIVALGRYTEKCVAKLLKSNCSINVELIYLPHPSPRAVNNQNWSEKASEILTNEGIMQYLKN